MDAHVQHASRKERVALWSVFASGVMAVLKFSAAFATGSLGLLSEAIHSLIDLGATLITLMAVRWGDRPADDNHHFGHAKIESLAALAEIMLLAGVIIWFTYESLSRLLWGGHEVTFTWWAVAILIISIVVDFNRSRALKKVAKEASSGALEADALHFDTDMYGSIAVLAGLMLVWLGLPWGDSAATLVVAAIIAIVAWRLAKQTIATLLDTAPEGVADDLRQEIEKHRHVLAVQQLRVRPAGPLLFISCIVEVPRTMPVAEMNVLQQDIRALIHNLYPSSDIIVSIHPVELDTETVFQKATLIAAQHGYAIHHLTVQALEGRMAVSFDVEFDGSERLDTAHEKATELEGAIRQALGGAVEVESHIEPLPLRTLEGQAANTGTLETIKTALFQSASNEALVSDIHNVRVRFVEGKHFVHYHCRFDGSTRVEDVHDVIDRIEQRLLASQPSIRRVVAHAEPIGRSRHLL